MPDDPIAPPVTEADVEAAAAAIHGRIRTTPVIEVDPADFGLSGFRLIFKLEFLQHAGSFKTRGAFNSLLTRPVPAAGVVAASGGNHGAAVAFAAGRLGIPARIFVPSIASPTKIAQIRSYGAELVIAGDRYADALAAAEACAAETGAVSIHAFDQPSTIAGQGTVAREFVTQAAPDSMLVATGGGGLVAGMAAWTGNRARLVAVEPEAAPSLHAAYAAGGPVDAPAGGYAADSLAPKRIGVLTHALAAHHRVGSVLVDDAAILQAQKDSVAGAAGGHRTRRRRGLCRPGLGRLPAATGRNRGRPALRRQYHRGDVSGNAVGGRCPPASPPPGIFAEQRQWVPVLAAAMLLSGVSAAAQTRIPAIAPLPCRHSPSPCKGEGRGGGASPAGSGGKCRAADPTSRLRPSPCRTPRTPPPPAP